MIKNEDIFWHTNQMNDTWATIGSFLADTETSRMWEKLKL